MRKFRALQGTAVAIVVALVVPAVLASSAMAAGGIKLCVPEKENAPVKTPKAGTCAPKYKLTELGAEGKEGAPGKEGAKGEPGPKGEEGPALLGSGTGSTEDDPAHTSSSSLPG